MKKNICASLPNGPQNLKNFIIEYDNNKSSILWLPGAKNWLWLTGKDPDAGEDWRQVEKGMTENEMVG